MKKKVTISAGIFCLLLLAWLVYGYYRQETLPREIPKSAPQVNQPETSKEKPKQEITSPNTLSPEAKPEQRAAEPPQSLSVEKNNLSESKQADLDEQSMSIRQEADKAYKILPGVTVEHNAVHVEISEDKSRTLEIEKNPANSHNEMQVLIKKKF